MEFNRRVCKTTAATATAAAFIFNYDARKNFFPYSRILCSFHTLDTLRLPKLHRHAQMFVCLSVCPLDLLQEGGRARTLPVVRCPDGDGAVAEVVAELDHDLEGGGGTSKHKLEGNKLTVYVYLLGFPKFIFRRGLPASRKLIVPVYDMYYL